MGVSTLELIIDKANKRLLNAFNSKALGVLPIVFNEDAYDVKVRVVEPSSVSSYLPFADVLDTYSVKVGIGKNTLEPTSGGFAFADKGSEQSSGTLTIGQAYLITDFQAGDNFTNVGGTNVTGNYFVTTGTTPTTWTNSSKLTKATATISSFVATTVQTAIRTLPNWTAATVTGDNPYRINRVTAGTGQGLDCVNVSLQPSSDVVSATLQTGTASVPQIEFFRFRQSLFALAQNFTDLPAASSTITEVTVGGASSSAVHRITLENDPYDGVFSIAYTISAVTKNTASIAFDAQAATIQAALESLTNIGSGKVSVTRTGNVIDVSFIGSLANTTIALPTVNVSGLKVPKGKIGELNLATNEMFAFLADSLTGTEKVTLEVELTPSSGNPVTIYSSEITVTDDLIKGQVTVPAPRQQYVTIDDIQSLFLLLTGGTMAGDIEMNGNYIRNVYLEDYLPVSGGNLAGALFAGGNAIVDPSIEYPSSGYITCGIQVDGLHYLDFAFRQSFTEGVLKIEKSDEGSAMSPVWATAFELDVENGDCNFHNITIFGARRKITTVSTSTTIARSNGIIVHCTAALTLTLWSADVESGDSISVRNTTTNANVTLNGGTKTIEGSTTQTILPGEFIEIYYDGTEWIVI